MERRGWFQKGALGAAFLFVGAGLFGCGSSPPNSQTSAVKGGNNDKGDNGGDHVGDNNEDKGQGDVSHTDLKVTENVDLTKIGCPGGTHACFDVSSEKNITHIFVDLDFGECSKDILPFSVTVDGQAVTKLHDKGGPCNEHGQKGEDYIPRIVWFPLPGNQKTATVCVDVAGAVPALVSVGAKSAEECVAATIHEDCQLCVTPPTDGGVPPDLCPPPPKCGANQTLLEGLCVCLPGFADCDKNADNGCEVDLDTDQNNCGQCGNVCPSNCDGQMSCVGGVCGGTPPIR